MPETLSSVNSPGILRRNEEQVLRLRQDKENDIKVSGVIQKINELLQNTHIQTYLDGGKDLDLWSDSTGDDKRRRRDSVLYITPGRQIVYLVHGEIRLREKVYEQTGSGFIHKASERTEREVVDQRDDRLKLGNPMGAPFGGDSDLRELIIKGKITPESIQKQVDYQTVSIPLTDTEQTLLNQKEQLDQLRTKFELLAKAGEYTKGYRYDEDTLNEYRQQKELLEGGLGLTSTEEELVKLCVDTWHSYWQEKGPETVEREQYSNFAAFLDTLKQLVESYERAGSAVESFQKREASRQARTDFLEGYKTPYVRVDGGDDEPSEKRALMPRVKQAIKTILSPLRLKSKKTEA